jgi:hypothetical protein
MSRLNIIGWMLMTVGFVIWGYGYFVTGHASLLDWSDLTPEWISEFIPNLEAEIGLAIMFGAMIPAYWRAKPPSK